MTSRIDYTIPYDREKIRSGDPMLMDEALYEIVHSLEDIHQKLVEETNGKIKSDFLDGAQKWTPILKENGTAATFTYTHQSGFVMRKGLMVDLWYDIGWSAMSIAPTAYLYVELPYVATLSTQIPFVGVMQPSGFTFTGGTECVLNVAPNTREGQIWNTGDGFVTAQQLAVASGRIIGYVRYIGKQNE